MSGFRHVVVFRWVEGTTVAQQEEVAARLRALTGVIPEIRAYAAGLDAGINPGNHEFAVVADFDSREDYLVYRDHPEHRAVIEELITPILAERAAVQYAI
ncbi:Dabb family protein [Actinomadura atramentaria]|uniref:Dabb family protein n=1 Tax=Actinomadura atramentaria TaxID=1990 RepID=UPI0003A6468B|nr:Dabb family protein [Actinomadura atramentaria]